MLSNVKLAKKNACLTYAVGPCNPAMTTLHQWPGTPFDDVPQDSALTVVLVGPLHAPAAYHVQSWFTPAVAHWTCLVALTRTATWKPVAAWKHCQFDGCEGDVM